MKKYLLFLFLLAGTASSTHAQSPLVGEWVGGTDALNGWRFVQVRVVQELNGLQGSLDVQSANVMRLPLTAILATADSLRFELATPLGLYRVEGKLEGTVMKAVVTMPTGDKASMHLVRVGVATERSDDFAGIYESKMAGKPPQSILVTVRPFQQLQVIVFESSGKTEAVARALMAIPLSKDSFFTSGSVIRSPDASEIIAFARNEKNEVTGLTWQRPDGEKLSATKAVAPFRQETISLQNAGVTLGGTLWLPLDKGPHPAIVMTQGSGPLTRAETALALRARELVKLGFAVLLYDKRGTGHPTGDWQAGFDALAEDALTGVRYLQTRPEIDAKRIGLQGNSNSGWVIPVAAARSKDVAFAVICSGGAVTPAEAEEHEANTWLRANKFSDEEVTHAVNLVKVKWKYARDGTNWNEYEALAKKASSKKWFAVINGPLKRDAAVWQGFQTMVRHEPSEAIAKITQPLLILFGEPERDQFVPVKQSAAEWERLLKKSGHQDFTIRTINGVGHGLFFREEQGRIVIAPEPFAVLGEWWAKTRK